MSHLIACVHATPRTIEPTKELLGQRAGEFSQHDICEERLFDWDSKTSEAARLFADTVHRADALRPAVIFTTCSLYTPRLPSVRLEVETPIVGIDEAMIQRAAGIGGRLALVGSRDDSIALTQRQIETCAARDGGQLEVVETLCVPVDSCDTPEGTQQLARQVVDLKRDVDAVVVVQMSLSPVRKYLSADEAERILTSPPLALEALRALVKSS